MKHEIEYTEFYSFWGELIERAEKNPNPTGSQSNRASVSWDLNAGWNGAVKLARDGWPKGEELIKQYSLELFDVVSSLIEQDIPTYDIEGSEIDISRYLEGEPECWMRMEARRVQGYGRRTISLVYQISASAGIHANVILARGAVVAALVELLEFAGIGVEIIISNAVFNVSSAEVRLLVKAFEQPLDIPRIAYAFAHPAMLRRTIFSILEQFPLDIRNAIDIKPYGSYGYPRDSIEQGNIYISKAMLGEVQWQNPIAAKSWILDQLKIQGVHLKAEK